MNINYKGARIFYTNSGTGKPLVLLHGFLEDSLIWQELVPSLSKERQVICIDLPGHGNSEGFSSIHTMEEMAIVVKNVLEELEIEKISLAGHSMGGYVALEFYNNFPMMVKSLMLINSTPVDDTEEKRTTRERSAKLVERNKNAYIKMAISNLFSEESKVKFCPQIEELQNRAYGLKVKDIQAALMGMKNRTNNVQLLRNADIPKFIVAGKEDPILDFNESYKISKECNCKFFATENGHNSYIEDFYNLRKMMHFVD